MKKYLLLLVLCGVFGLNHAQEATVKSDALLMFVHAGLGVLPDKTSGLTSSKSDYVGKLSSGLEWNIQIYHRHKRFISGLMYSGYSASGKLENSSDKILTTYVAPQVGFNFPIVGDEFDIVLNAGIGGMWYRNNGSVFGNPRKVNGSTFGANLGLKGVYNFTQNVGASLEISTIRANLYKTNNKYHDETIRVRYPDTLHLNQLTFSFGLKFSF